MADISTLGGKTWGIISVTRKEYHVPENEGKPNLFSSNGHQLRQRNICLDKGECLRNSGNTCVHCKL